MLEIIKTQTNSFKITKTQFVNNPVERDGKRWFAFPHPQVIFQFHDAFTGELRYSETYVLGMD